MGMIQTGWANCQRFVGANYPYILSGIGAVGIFVTVWRAIEDTFKAEDALEQKSEEVGGRELTMREKVTTVAPCYISTAISAVTSAACVIGGVVGSHRMAVVAAGLYEASELRRRSLENAIRDQLGEDEAAEVERKANGTVRNLRDDGTPYQDVTADQDQEVWFQDDFGQRFKATWKDVAQAETHVWQLINNQMCATVNDFYEYLQLSGINVITCDKGDYCEWNNEYPPYIVQSEECILDPKTGIPYVILKYKTDPRLRM